MKNFNRVIALVLVVLTLIPMLVACGEKKGGSNGNVVSTEINTTVPDDLKFEGQTFTVLCREDNAWGDYKHEIAADEGETELVNQAIYERNEEVKARFGLEDLVALDIPGHWTVAEDFVNTYRNSIQAGSQSYDLIMSQAAYMANPDLTDLYMNMYEVPYVKDNLNAPHYFSDVTNELTVNGQLKFIVGDYSLTYWENIYVMFFNKNLAEDYNLENIYDLVNNGEWTVDKLIELSKDRYTDDGNTEVGSEDTFGYISDINNTTDALVSQFDVPVTQKDENGNIVVNMDQGKVVNILETMIDFKKTNDTYMVGIGSDTPKGENPLDEIFVEGRALFYPDALGKAQSFQDMEDDYGIIPYPKWDEAQETYYTHAQDGFSVAVIPTDAPNKELSGAVLDVISGISNAKVVPAYYDQALKFKYSRDEDTGTMLNIIRDGIRFNFGYFYGYHIGCGNIFRTCIADENPNFVSYYGANEKGYTRRLKEVIRSYSEE